jgi:hypothetical protein
MLCTLFTCSCWFNYCCGFFAAIVDWSRTDRDDSFHQLIRLKWQTFTLEFNPKVVCYITHYLSCLIERFAFLSIDFLQKKKHMHVGM